MVVLGAAAVAFATCTPSTLSERKVGAHTTWYVWNASCSGTLAFDVMMMPSVLPGALQYARETSLGWLPWKHVATS